MVSDSAFSEVLKIIYQKEILKNPVNFFDLVLYIILQRDSR